MLIVAIGAPRPSCSFSPRRCPAPWRPDTRARPSSRWASPATKRAGGGESVNVHLPAHWCGQRALTCGRIKTNPRGWSPVSFGCRECTKRAPATSPLASGWAGRFEGESGCFDRAGWHCASRSTSHRLLPPRCPTPSAGGAVARPANSISRRAAATALAPTGTSACASGARRMTPGARPSACGRRASFDPRG
jgi:hypothetical protein